MLVKLSAHGPTTPLLLGFVGSLHVVVRTWSEENYCSLSDQQLKRKGLESPHFKGMSQVTCFFLLDPTTQRLHHFLVASHVGNEALTHEHLTLSKPWQPGSQIPLKLHLALETELPRAPQASYHLSTCCALMGQVTVSRSRNSLFQECGL